MGGLNPKPHMGTPVDVRENYEDNQVQPSRSNGNMRDAIAARYVSSKHIVTINTNDQLRPCTVSTGHVVKDCMKQNHRLHYRHSLIIHSLYLTPDNADEIIIRTHSLYSTINGLKDIMGFTSMCF